MMHTRYRVRLVFWSSIVGGIGVCGAAAPSSMAQSWAEVSPEFRAQQTDAGDQRGNWRFKKQIHAQAGHLYQEIRDQHAHVEELQQSLLAQRGEVDRAHEQFVLNLGVTPFEVQTVLSQKQEELAHMETRLTELNALMAAPPSTAPIPTTASPSSTPSERPEDERARLESSKSVHEEQIKELEALRDHLELINRIEESLNKAYGVLVDQVGIVRSLEASAWSLYDRIAYTFDDVAAATYYREIQAARKNIQAIYAYIQGDFSRFIAHQTQTLMQYMSFAQQAVHQAQTSGLFGSKEPVAEVSPEATPEPVVVKPAPSWWQRVGTTLMSWWNGIKQWIASWFSHTPRKKSTPQSLTSPEIAQAESVASVIPEPESEALIHGGVQTGQAVEVESAPSGLGEGIEGEMGAEEGFIVP